MNNENDFQNEVDKLIQKILDSPSLKKLVIAGPGTGKTTLFKQAINHISGDQKEFLALTFINNLEEELKKELEGIAKVHTFHGYCHYLLARYRNLRRGLNDNFRYYPPLIEIVKRDWEIVRDDSCPRFVDQMRSLEQDEALLYFIEKGNYYNAVGYDDSIYRVFKSFEDKEIPQKYKLIIVDEYQDFNLLETSTLAKLIEINPVLIAGDDDQALYCDLRGSDPDYIRKLFGLKDFDNFELPFCFRCPSPVVSVFNHLVEIARNRGFIKNRINKKFNPSPTKKKDSENYPTVKLVSTSVQMKSSKVNYFGKYIVREIDKITKEEINESYEKGFPTVMIIGPKHFLNSITPALDEEKITYELRKNIDGMKVELEDGLKILKQDGKSNLGWRIVLESSKPEFYEESVKAISDGKRNLIDVLPERFIKEFTVKFENFELPEITEQQKDLDKSKPSIKLTTFEGAKGLSAQHVFVVGLQNGILPRNSESIKDIDLCKFLVSITRSRKQCHILTTYRFAGKSTQVSEFIKWLLEKDIPELEKISINKDYWGSI